MPSQPRRNFCIRIVSGFSSLYTVHHEFSNRTIDEQTKREVQSAALINQSLQLSALTDLSWRSDSNNLSLKLSGGTSSADVSIRVSLSFLRVKKRDLCDRLYRTVRGNRVSFEAGLEVCCQYYSRRRHSLGLKVFIFLRPTYHHIFYDFLQRLSLLLLPLCKGRFPIGLVWIPRKSD